MVGTSSMHVTPHGMRVFRASASEFYKGKCVILKRAASGNAAALKIRANPD